MTTYLVDHPTAALALLWSSVALLIAGLALVVYAATRRPGPKSTAPPPRPRAVANPSAPRR